MKRFLSLVIAAVLAVALASCGILVDYDTPKSEELSAEYDFYSDSQRSLTSGMNITPEQADDAFIVLVSCGMDSKVSNVTRKVGDDGHCTVTSRAGKFDVYYTDGVIDRVEKSGEQLYPAPAPSEPAVIEPAVTEPAEPEAPATLEEAVNVAIESINAEKEDVQLFNTYSEDNPEERRVAIYLADDGNLTTNLTRKGLWMKTSDILEILQPRDDIAEIVIYWSLPLIDASGNPFTDTVMKIDVSKATLDEINFERFDWNNIPAIADEYFQHQVLNEE